MLMFVGPVGLHAPPEVAFAMHSWPFYNEAFILKFFMFILKVNCKNLFVSKFIFTFYISIKNKFIIVVLTLIIFD